MCRPLSLQATAHGMCLLLCYGHFVVMLRADLLQTPLRRLVRQSVVLAVSGVVLMFAGNSMGLRCLMGGDWLRANVGW
jgi:hypothetical protein